MQCSYDSTENFSSFRAVPKTGVIYVTTEAMKRGFSPSNSSWANLGQGAPETASLLESHELIDRLYMEYTKLQNEYAPVAGLYELRESVARLYNELYRTHKQSKYTAENVAISSGGRAGLTRIAAVLGDIHVGHFIPDYTAYEELLTTFKGFTPIPLLLDEDHGYTFDSDTLRTMIQKFGLSALLLSNPSNPTGRLIRGNDLECYVRMAREEQCALIIDEFYSHYVYEMGMYDGANIVSAARFIEDVDRDPLIILDGLTKNWRRPGWRISWTLAPKDIIERIASAGSFLDGGAPHPLQRAAIQLVDSKRVTENSRSLQAHFLHKRNYMLERLSSLNISVPLKPQGAFYCWARLDKLPKSLSNGMALFHAGLAEKVIIVPGEFFDVNPGKRRKSKSYQNYARISFGPSIEVLSRGIDAFERVIKNTL